MYQIPTNKISLIFDRKFAPHPREILTQIQNLGAPFDRFRFHADCDDGLILLVDDAMHIVVNSKNQPMAGKYFDAALATPSAQPNDLQWRHLIRQHQAVMTLSVGTGTLGSRGESTQNPQLFERAMPLTERAKVWDLLHRLMVQVMAIKQPLALLFHASNHLIDPAQIAADNRVGLPLKCMINPVQFSSGTKKKGQPTIGFRAMGSEVILGRSLILHEIDLPLEQSVIWASKVMQKCLDNGALFANGHHCSDFEGAILDIRQRPPSEANPFGTFELLFSDVHRAREIPVTADTLRQSIFGRRALARQARHMTHSH